MGVLLSDCHSYLFTGYMPPRAAGPSIQAAIEIASLKRGRWRHVLNGSIGLRPGATADSKTGSSFALRWDGKASQVDGWVVAGARGFKAYGFYRGRRGEWAFRPSTGIPIPSPHPPRKLSEALLCPKNGPSIVKAAKGMEPSIRTIKIM